MSKINNSILLISDMHMPYEHQDTVPFLAALQKKYKFQRVISLGDEVDKHAISYHESDPDLPSAGDELSEAIEHLEALYKIFPKMDVIASNHGSLAFRKARTAGIPKRYLKDYKDVLQAPAGWNWHYDLLIPIPGGNQLYIHHGLASDVMKVVAQRGVCVVQGHYHTQFRIGYLGNPNHLLWGMNIGCLIDSKSPAFDYDRNRIARPVVGLGCVLNGLPKLLPMVLDKKGRWNKEVP